MGQTTAWQTWQLLRQSSREKWEWVIEQGTTAPCSATLAHHAAFLKQHHHCHRMGMVKIKASLKDVYCHCFLVLYWWSDSAWNAHCAAKTRRTILWDPHTLPGGDDDADPQHYQYCWGPWLVWQSPHRLIVSHSPSWWWEAKLDLQQKPASGV